MQSYPIVEMRAVTRRFEDSVAVDALSLAVPAGLTIGLIGPSGAGKTTTVRLMTGALSPSAGDIRVLGEDPRRLSRRARARIGYMPQLPSVDPGLTAAENVDFAASLFGLLWLKRHRRVRQVLDLVGLGDVRGRRAGRLSGGMRRRVELASALVHDPDLLFLDEPTAGLDPILRGVVWDELHRLRSLGRTILVTTQHVNEAGECDFVALIAEGRLVAFSSPDELRRSATGGDVIEIETVGQFDPFVLVGVEGVRRIERTGAMSFRAIVADAGRATPSITSALAAAGATIGSTREWRPSFDEVFATLVSRAGETVRDGRSAAVQPLPVEPPAPLEVRASGEQPAALGEAVALAGESRAPAGEPIIFEGEPPARPVGEHITFEGEPPARPVSEPITFEGEPPARPVAPVSPPTEPPVQPDEPAGAPGPTSEPDSAPGPASDPPATEGAPAATPDAPPPGTPDAPPLAAPDARGAGSDVPGPDVPELVVR